MKILCIADEENPAYWEYFEKSRLEGVDLILSAGDLKPEYLSFLVTMGHAPLYYVHGNHDGNYETTPPEGCECIEDRVVTVQGVRILGLGGCLQYRPAPHQYTEREMQQRIRRQWLPLRRGVDIVLTHAPVQGLGDLPGRTHQGFACFRTMLEKYHPRYLLHGHVHMRYQAMAAREREYQGTQIVNVCGTYLLELPDGHGF